MKIKNLLLHVALLPALLVLMTPAPSLAQNNKPAAQHPSHPKAKAQPKSHPKSHPHTSSMKPRKAAQRQVPHVQRSSGKIDTTANGQGTYSRKIIHDGNKTFVDTTDKFADGKTITTDATYIKHPNGSFTRDATTDNNGKMSTLDENFHKTGNGDYSITGKSIGSNGQVDSVKGTDDRTKYGTDTNVDYTNSAGQNMDKNIERMHAGNATGSVMTGTGFNGKAISGASLSVSNSRSRQVVDTTANGHGSYTNNQVGTGPNSNMNVNQTNYNNGASSTGVNQVTHNSNGTTTVQNNTQNTNAHGVQSLGSSTKTYTPTGNGNSSISGTYSQGNGSNYGTLSGTQNKTGYGNNTNTTYTNQNGQTSTVDTEHLSVGGATLNVNSGNTYNGGAINSSNLSTNGQGAGR